MSSLKELLEMEDSPENPPQPKSALEQEKEPSPKAVTSEQAKPIQNEESTPEVVIMSSDNSSSEVKNLPTPENSAIKDSPTSNDESKSSDFVSDTQPNHADATPVDYAYWGPNLDAPLFPTTLSLCLDRMTEAFNNITGEILPRDGLSAIQDDSMAAELKFKTFDDAVFDLTNEFTKMSTTWELRHPEQAYEDERADLERAIHRQEALIRNVKNDTQRAANYDDLEFEF